MRYYVAFALNLVGFVLQIGIMVRDPPPRFWNVAAAVITLHGMRVMFPFVRDHLRGK